MIENKLMNKNENPVELTDNFDKVEDEKDMNVDVTAMNSILVDDEISFNLTPSKRGSRSKGNVKQKLKSELMSHVMRRSSKIKIDEKMEQVGKNDTSANNEVDLQAHKMKVDNQIPSSKIGTETPTM